MTTSIATALAATAVPPTRSAPTHASQVPLPGAAASANAPNDAMAVSCPRAESARPGPADRRVSTTRAVIPVAPTASVKVPATAGVVAKASVANNGR